MSEWLTTKLGDVLEITNGYAFKSINFRSELEAGCLPVLKIKNVANGDVHINDVQYHHFEEKLSKYTAQKGDILISLTGNHPHAETQVVGAVSKLKMNIRAFVNQRVAKIDTKPNLADKDYIYFALKEEGLSKYLASQSSGSANQANISKADIEDLDVALPPLPEQKAIASVLSSLDDKIDLLHRQNKTLEAMAETLFRQWFIEEAKEDWSEFYIRDLEIYIADYVANGSFASLKENVTLITERSDYALFIRNTDLKSNFANKVYVDEHSYNFLVKTKLYGGEVIISNVADVGSVHLCPRFNIPMTLGNNIIMLRSKFNYFLYLYFTSNVGQDALYAITSGSAQQKFNKTDFRALKISLPNLAILDEFNELVSPYFIKKEYNLNQIQTLENLRDTLLPKLMSGEVRVQYQTEEVA